MTIYYSRRPLSRCVQAELSETARSFNSLRVRKIDVDVIIGRRRHMPPTKYNINAAIAIDSYQRQLYNALRHQPIRIARSARDRNKFAVSNMHAWLPMTS